jgi:hypothetical protein
MENNKNIWLLPTNEPSRLYFDVVTKELMLQKKLSFNATSFPIEKRNIYITNSEEIRRDDLCMDILTKWIFRATRQIKEKHNFYQKIILTDNQDLINDGAQPIPDEFLEWFVKNPSCERVEVEEHQIDTWDLTVTGYKIIIPKVSKPTSMENKTPMQDLLQDLKESKITSFEALNDINDKFIRETCQTSVTKTLDCIIERIETELLPKEKQMFIDFFIDGEVNCGRQLAQDYYNEKFNNTDN